jgi:transposase
VVATALSISPASVVRWSQRLRATGSAAPSKMGGNRPAKIVGEHRLWLLQRIDSGGFTLRGLVAELAERGFKINYRTMWKFVHSLGLSYKIRPSRQANSSGRTLPGAAPAGSSTSAGLTQAPGVHRRDVDQDQHGAAARLGREGPKAPRTRAARPLEDDDLPCRSAA